MACEMATMRAESAKVFIVSLLDSSLILVIIFHLVFPFIRFEATIFKHAFILCILSFRNGN